MNEIIVGVRNVTDRHLMVEVCIVIATFFCKTNILVKNIISREWVFFVQKSVYLKDKYIVPESLYNKILMSENKIHGHEKQNQKTKKLKNIKI